MEKIRMGVSACLLGEKVRFDGQHKLDGYIAGTLSQWFDFVPVCPEFELGLGVPRESMRLEGDPANPRLVTNKTRQDLTGRMQAWCAERVKALEAENLHGFIFKSRSPSSGMERVKVYQANGQVIKKGSGLFAKAFMEHFPLLPVEEEGRLQDPGLRENFIGRVLVLKRWREMLQNTNTRGGLVEFHARHKYLLMAHSIPLHRKLGQIVAEVKGRPLAQVQEEYLDIMMQALRLRATASKHVNVLQHMAGYFKKQLSPDEKQELQEIIGHFSTGLVPRVVPVTLINHYVRKYNEPYLAGQHYLAPDLLWFQ